MSIFFNISTPELEVDEINDEVCRTGDFILGESALHDQRSPDGDLLLLLPGHVVPDALLEVQLHDRPLSNNSVLFPPSVGPSGRAWLVDTSADVVQQDAERIHQGYQGWDGKNGGSKETKEAKETNRGAEVRRPG